VIKKQSKAKEKMALPMVEGISELNGIDLDYHLQRGHVSLNYTQISEARMTTSGITCFFGDV
jgi:hypothetical protein